MAINSRLTESDIRKIVIDANKQLEYLVPDYVFVL